MLRRQKYARSQSTTPFACTLKTTSSRRGKRHLDSNSCLKKAILICRGVTCSGLRLRLFHIYEHRHFYANKAKHRCATFVLNAAKQGGFKRGVFPIWTCPFFFVLFFLSFLGLFCPFCPFLSFPGFSRFARGSGDFPDSSLFSFSAY